MPFIIGANSAGGDFSVDNSCKFNRAGSAYMHITPGGAGSTTTFTFSAWLKRGTITSNQMFFEVGAGGTSDDFLFYFHSGDTVKIFDYDGGGTNIAILTNQVFRDPSAWYHLVLAVDTTQVTDTNRVKLYVNGTQVTSLATATYPVQDFVLDVNSTDTHWIGRRGDGVDYFDGYMAEVCLIDGTQYAASDFGEFNEDSPTIWQPKSVSGLTFGTNGFYLDFEDSSDLGKDVSGNGNDLTAVNITATDQATDTPTNNFATANSNMISTTDVVLTEGNLTVTSDYASGWQYAGSTFAVNTGKWYWEAKATVVAATDKTFIGVGQFNTGEVDFVGDANLGLSNGLTGHGAGVGSYSYAQGDIIMVAMDITNNKIYYGDNGTWFGTLDPAAGTGATTQTVDNNNFCMPMVGGYGGSSWDLNFGYPAFTVSSGNADANGYGNFEYAVPTGFLALCSKNLGSDGG
tara:strand:+ start:429 stop:1805 length:1377 start_codon:yes stop_codon:yes gene_type:complete